MFLLNKKFLRFSDFEKSKAMDGRTDGRTDGRGATLNVATREGRIMSKRQHDNHNMTLVAFLVVAAFNNNSE